MNHHLKILPEHYEAVVQGLKLAELRKNDRDYMAGDVLHLHEWKQKYTGRYASRIVVHVADVGEYLPGYVLLSMCGNYKRTGDEANIPASK